MSNSSELILRRMLIYLDDVIQILHHEHLTDEEITSLAYSINAIEEKTMKLRLQLMEQREYEKEYEGIAPDPGGW